MLTAWALVNGAATWSHFIAGRTTSATYATALVMTSLLAGILMLRYSWSWSPS